MAAAVALPVGVTVNTCAAAPLGSSTGTTYTGTVTPTPVTGNRIRAALYIGEP